MFYRLGWGLLVAGLGVRPFSVGAERCGVCGKSVFTLVRYTWRDLRTGERLRGRWPYGSRAPGRIRICRLCMGEVRYPVFVRAWLSARDSWELAEERWYWHRAMTPRAALWAGDRCMAYGCGAPASGGAGVIHHVRYTKSCYRESVERLLEAGSCLWLCRGCHRRWHFVGEA